VVAGNAYRIVVTGEGGMALTDASNSDFTIAEGFPSSIQPVTADESGFQLFPNPATQEFTIRYTLHREEEVKISLYTVQGMELAIVGIPDSSPGTHTFIYPVEQYPAGTYIVVFRKGDRETATLLQIH
jgi:hypothetical protein